MQSQSMLLSYHYVWGVLTERFEAALLVQKLEIWRLSGLLEMFGPLGDHFTGESEGNESIKQIAGFLVRALAFEMEARERAIESQVGRGVGRPRSYIIPYLGPEMVSLFLRYHGSGGRHSVATWIDGKPAQAEAGPLVEFATLVIVPLNEVLVGELHCKPLSPARLVRYGLRALRYGS